MIKIGLFGVGHLGKIHLRLLKGLTADYQFVGFYDPDAASAQKVAAEYGVRAFASVDDLLDAVDAVDIVTPTLTHYDLASRAVKKFKHVFIEKPVTTTPDEARRLEALVREAGVKAMVGHVERYNPALLTLKALAEQRADQGFELAPMFIELHRLAIWNPRSTDISVVADLMIHDIDIVQHLIKSAVKKVTASGTAVIADTPDIANARIEFHNGAVANLTASRISLKNMRRMRIFQRGAYVTVDFLEKKTELYHLVDDAQLGSQSAHTTWQWHDRTRHLVHEQPEVAPVNAIELELKRFAEAIRNNSETEVPLHDAYLALQTAAQIEQKIAGGGGD